MTILLVAHTKGGVSKTTTAINLAVMRAQQGREVLLVDCDAGLSASAWAGQRSKNELLPVITCPHLFGDAVHKQVKLLSKKYDDIIIDAGGEGEGAPEIRLILTIADKVLTPCRTAKADTDRLKKIHDMIREVRGINEELDAMLFPTQASTHTYASDVIKFYGEAANFQEYRLLETVMRTRNAYQEWMATGEAVIEQKSLDEKAVTEMRQLYAEVFND